MSHISNDDAWPSNLGLVRFDMSGWQEVGRSSNDVLWRRDTVVGVQDALSLAILPPQDLPMVFTREDWLPYARSIAKPGGIVSVDSCAVQTSPAIQIIYKRQEDAGYMYSGWLVVRLGEEMYFVIASCHEGPSSGMREAVLTAELIGQKKVVIRKYPFYERWLNPGKAAYLKGWFADPYRPNYRGAILCSLADDQHYDSRFPDHPLTRLRAILQHVRDTMQIGEG